MNHQIFNEYQEEIKRLKIQKHDIETCINDINKKISDDKLTTTWADAMRKLNYHSKLEINGDLDKQIMHDFQFVNKGFRQYNGRMTRYSFRKEDFSQTSVTWNNFALIEREHHKAVIFKYDDVWYNTLELV